MYGFCRVDFCLNASPYLLNATSRYHISKNANAVDDLEFVRKFLESFYVDDYVRGRSSSKDVAALCGKTGKRTLEGGFKLRKWFTNDASVRRDSDCIFFGLVPGHHGSKISVMQIQYSIKGPCDPSQTSFERAT